MQIYVDKWKRLVQGVCIDSATRWFLSLLRCCRKNQERPSHPMKTYRILLGKQPLAAVAATSYGQALAIAHATFPHLAHLPLVLKRI